MRAGRPSGSAESIALVRAHLTSLGILEDVYAQRFLRRPRQIALKAIRWLSLGLVTKASSRWSSSPQATTLERGVLLGTP